MFGKNIILKVVREDPSALPGCLSVHSVFYTIQGEGPYAGRASVFVRLYGCSLACSWCDTDFESVNDFNTPHELLHRVMGLAPVHCRLIVITGGEPLRQNVVPFVKLASNQGYTVQIETAGVHCPEGLEELVRDSTVDIVCSPKTHRIDRGIENIAMFYKYIIDAREEADPMDGLPRMAVSQRNEPATATLYRPRQRTMHSRIYVQPLEIPEEGFELFAASKHNWENRQRCADLVMKYGYRLSLQQHKILGLP